MAKRSMTTKPASKAKRTVQSFEVDDAEIESTSSTSTGLLEQDQNPRNIQSTLTNPSAPLPPQQFNRRLHDLANATVTVLEDSGYNLGYLQLQMARYAKSRHSYPRSMASSNNTQQEPVVSSLSNLGRQPRTKLYRYQCIFKDNNGRCQTRGRGPPGKVSKFLCEEHTVQEEQKEQEEDEDEKYKDEDGGAEGEIVKGDEDEAHTDRKLLRSGRRI